MIAERDYILLSDLKTVRILKMIARDLVAESNPDIGNIQYRDMMRSLSEWEDNMQRRLERKQK